ncbi:MAG: phosphoribosylglycinamide formyltransferase [Porphyromonadaceae bacterium]|nr:phosphoribosylglycinamide formyltransferase [Porphyromonadaceae bacterium]
MNKLAILASGSGSNAETIAKYFANHPSIRVACILTNRADAGVIARAERLEIPCYQYRNAEMRSGDAPLKLLKELEVDLVVLAGYLCLITPPWLATYPNRILNIHPALLPSYGGKGMYGHHVHEAVLAAGEGESGITIHLVDEEYDHGRHLLQATCSVRPDDTADTLANRIHTLEHRFYAPTIEQYLTHDL